VLSDGLLVVEEEPVADAVLDLLSDEAAGFDSALPPSFDDDGPADEDADPADSLGDDADSALCPFFLASDG
jgi:hypothetical protein